MIIAIASVDKNFGIGYNNELLEMIPGDMNYFKIVTKDKIVIMGSNTWESLPNKPLENRFNAIITRTPPEEKRTETYGFYTWEEIKSFLSKDLDVNIFIIGGGYVYKELLPYCDKIYLTYMDIEHENVDTYFPELTEEEWQEVMVGDWEEHEGISYQFRHYERIK